VVGGVGIGLSSLEALVMALPEGTLPSAIEAMIHAGHSHGHGHPHAVAIADPLALYIAGASIGIKEWLFRASPSLPSFPMTNSQPRKLR
jgi:hypothetical protein